MVDRPSSLVKRGFVTRVRKSDGRSELVRRRGERGIRNEATREPAGDTARLCVLYDRGYLDLGRTACARARREYCGFGVAIG